jgi:hypothetical protein
LRTRRDSTLGDAGSFVNLIGVAAPGLTLGDYLEFSAYTNAPAQSIFSTDHRADDLDGALEVHVRAQSVTGSTTYCFNAPASTGKWELTGSVVCIGGGLVQEANGNPVEFTPSYSGIARGVSSTGHAYRDQ